MKEPLLQLKNVTSGYKDKEIINNISFTLGVGERILIEGKNGSGKSTLLKTIFRLITNNSGSIIFKGKSLDNCMPYELQNLGISYFKQGGLVIPTLTVIDHLTLALKSKSKKEKVRLEMKCFKTFPVIEKKLLELAGNLSGGQKQILTCAILICQDTDLWLLDEPLSGLDKKCQAILIEFFKDENDKSIILIEHSKHDIRFSNIINLTNYEN